MNISEPTQDNFNSAQQAAVSILKDYNTEIDSKKGSIVRQLVIRPIAYIYARMNQLLSSWVRRTSVSYLSNTDDTSDSIADLVASNYFVSRRQGGYAKGILTLVCDQEEVRISVNTSFFIASHQFRVEKAYIATPNIEGTTDTEQLGYIKMVNVDGYKANLPIVAVNPGIIEIPSGAQVDINSYIAGCSQAQLLSPITGGADVETNAQLMARCKERCGAAVGTLEAIRTKMQTAPITVLSCNAQGSSEPGCFRSRYNSVALPMGGVIDIYAKTQNQNDVTDINFDHLKNSNGTLYVKITSQDYPDVAGASRVLSVKKQGDQTTIKKYTVTYSSSSSLSPVGARGSVDQVIIITFDDPTLTADTKINVTLEYMPGVKVLQDFINNEYQKFLGQNCLVKAALPVVLSITGQVFSDTALTDSTIQQVKEAISQSINSKLVGDYNLNMDKIAESVEANFPGIKLRLPYKISVQVPTINGGIHTFATTDGTVSLLYREGSYHYSQGVYFFSSSPSNIYLEVLE